MSFGTPMMHVSTAEIADRIYTSAACVIKILLSTVLYVISAGSNHDGKYDTR